ncbi:MAG: 50S ribosomal protein L4 [Planctomycetaceae bacterium]|nr:50S ribosomal protein L4 [Planctomycetaceae bacterium]
MASVEVKNAGGAAAGVVEFDSALLESKVTPRLLRDAYVMYETCQRQGTVKIKTKGEISGSKKKLFRQKGTGNARMGQKRTPVRVGGGNAFGKQPKDWSYRLPKKALRVATRMALVGKLKDGEIVVVDQFKQEKPKTKEVAQLLKMLSVAGKSCLLVVGDYDKTLWLSTRNIPRLTLTTAGWLNSHDLLKHRAVVMTREAFNTCVARFTA